MTLREKLIARAPRVSWPKEGVSVGTVIRPRLQRLLMMMCVLSAAVWLWPPGSDAVAVSSPVLLAQRTSVLASPAGLPANLPSFHLAPMRHDPFADSAVPAPPAATAVLAAASFLPPPPPSRAATAPTLAAYRYLGTLVGIDGGRRVFLTQDDQHHELALGGRLPDGQVVESLGPLSVRLRHPAGDVVTDLPLPAPPEPGP